MSSYFDTAVRLASAAVEAGNRAKAVEVAQSVYNRIDAYLKWISAHALKAESPKVENLVKRFKALPKESIQSRPVEFIGWELHEMGHEIGRAGVAIRGGRIAGDNPYFPGYYGAFGAPG